jgi:hypothetical protein
MCALVSAGYRSEACTANLRPAKLDNRLRLLWSGKQARLTKAVIGPAPKKTVTDDTI